MPRPKSLQPRRKKITLTVDAAVWERCQNLSSRLPFMNWSEMAEISFVSILDVFENSLNLLIDGHQPQEVVDEILKSVDVQYHEMVLEAKKSKLSQSPTVQATTQISK